jgi:hypothetical protein
MAKRLKLRDVMDRLPAKCAAWGQAAVRPLEVRLARGAKDNSSSADLFVEIA